MAVEIKKIPGGFEIDGLPLIGMRCGCPTTLKCCFSWSKIKKKGSNLFDFTAKMSTPDTRDIFNWGYTVLKEGITIKVAVEDARDKEIYSGFIPPPVEAWEAKGWKVETKTGKREDGVVWRCAMCKWIYKEDKVEKPFSELEPSWFCPICRAKKTEFEKVG